MIVGEKIYLELTCERCGYHWHNWRGKAPKSCARCKSKYWNEPRVYSGKYVPATICQRVKTTGRKAGKIKFEKRMADYRAELRRSELPDDKSSD